MNGIIKNESDHSFFFILIKDKQFNAYKALDVQRYDIIIKVKTFEQHLATRCIKAA